MKLNCIDLFAGAGGFSLAAQRAGFTVKLAIENDRHACSTYRHNFPNGNEVLREADITTLTPKELLREAYELDEPCDLLMGGPPCQGFSTHRINGAGIRDPRNSLIHTYFEFVESFQPSLFLMENVPGMLWDRHAEFLDAFYKRGKTSGYEIKKPVVIDARDFGVPQRRQRVFILGVKNEVDTEGLVWPPKPTHGDEKARRESKQLKSWISCAGVFKRAPAGDRNNISMNHTNALIKVFKRTPKNGGSRADSGRVLDCHKNHDGHKDVYGRIDPKQPAPTMTTACINPSKGRFVHPTQHHGITIRQAARIQTFPDDFVFQGGLIAAGEQIGNAVPVLLGEHLLRVLAPVARKARRGQKDA